MPSQFLIVILVLIFILYRSFRRVRRSIGWQRLNPEKMRTFTVILFVIGSIFLAEGASHAISLVSDAAGILIGIILACYGAATTRFEKRDGGWHYRPNTWIGIAVTVLFFGRLIYRIYVMFAMTTSDAAPNGSVLGSGLQSMASGWTSGLLLIMFAYYIAYNIILLRKQKRMVRAGSR